MTEFGIRCKSFTVWQSTNNNNNARAHTLTIENERKIVLWKKAVTLNIIRCSNSKVNVSSVDSVVYVSKLLDFAFTICFASIILSQQLVVSFIWYVSIICRGDIFNSELLCSSQNTHTQNNRRIHIDFGMFDFENKNRN